MFDALHGGGEEVEVYLQQYILHGEIGGEGCDLEDWWWEKCQLQEEVGVGFRYDMTWTFLHGCGVQKAFLFCRHGELSTSSLMNHTEIWHTQKVLFSHFTIMIINSISLHKCSTKFMEF